MSLRVLAAGLTTSSIVALLLVFWAHVPGPVGFGIAAVVAAGTIIGLSAVDDDGERVDAAWRAAAPDLASPAPPVADLREDPELPAIMAADEAERAAAAAAAAPTLTNDGVDRPDDSAARG